MVLDQIIRHERLGGLSNGMTAQRELLIVRTFAGPSPSNCTAAEIASLCVADRSSFAYARGQFWSAFFGLFFLCGFIYIHHCLWTTLRDHFSQISH